YHTSFIDTYFVMVFISTSYSLRRTPRPPSSSLFPYTTLFRSPIDDLLDDAGFIAHEDDTFLNNAILGCEPGSPWMDDIISGARRDRKSTRLNSSHVSISYAVFCL